MHRGVRFVLGSMALVGALALGIASFSLTGFSISEGVFHGVGSLAALILGTGGILMMVSGNHEGRNEEGEKNFEEGKIKLVPAWKWFWEIRVFLQERLLLRLKPEVKLLPLSNGIDFLGYIVRPWSIFVRRRVLKNFKRKLATADTELIKMKMFFFEKNTAERKHFQSTFSSYIGHFKHANSFKIKQKTMVDFPFTKLCF